MNGHSMGSFVPVRPWAVFKADFPDDLVENEKDIVTFGGRNVAEAIGGILRSLGCDVEEPRYAGENGWDFTARLGRRRFWCQVTSFHPIFFLLFEDDPPMQAAAGHVGLAEKLNVGLRADGRFHDILWYTLTHGPVETPDGAGAASPLVAPPIDYAARPRRMSARTILWIVGWLALCALYYGAKWAFPAL